MQIVSKQLHRSVKSVNAAEFINNLILAVKQIQLNLVQFLFSSDSGSDSIIMLNIVF